VLLPRSVETPLNRHRRCCSMPMTLARHACPNAPAAWRQQASRTLDEAMSAAYFSLILASTKSLACSGQTGSSWFSLVGVPV
jgi:hypothetical protein